MHKIIEAQGPSGCSTDLGKLDRRHPGAARRRGRGDRLPAAQPAGAHRRRADRQGRRHQDLQEDRRPGRAGRAALPHPCLRRSRNSIWRSPAPRPMPAMWSVRTPRGESEAVTAPPCSACRIRGGRGARGWRRGSAFHARIAVHRFPDGELRVTVGPAAATTIIYASLDQPNDKLLALLFAARPCGAAVQSGWCWSRPIFATCGRTRPFMKARRSARRSIGRLLAQGFDRVITVDAHLHRTRISTSISRYRGRRSFGRCRRSLRRCARRPRSGNGRGRT